ncbi:hypothetical protein DFP72DRAFT_1067673 [Ephemerocybe angulata]|uniref:Uncharacterized protein n=1 Tax=Ephemerocybe angulata TaxID=980116 RepID=A0A8H6HY57_9AGAR|nr:hypothetical protein DFP72DRAFT_1067673 [Tulosesus angulatus]
MLYLAHRRLRPPLDDLAHGKSIRRVFAVQAFKNMLAGKRYDVSSTSEGARAPHHRCRECPPHGQRSIWSFAPRSTQALSPVAILLFPRDSRRI